MIHITSLLLPDLCSLWTMLPVNWPLNPSSQATCLYTTVNSTFARHVKLYFPLQHTNVKEPPMRYWDYKNCNYELSSLWINPHLGTFFRTESAFSQMEPALFLCEMTRGKTLQIFMSPHKKPKSRYIILTLIQLRRFLFQMRSLQWIICQ